MPKAGVVPTCRYEHGELKKIEGGDWPKAFVISGPIPNPAAAISRANSNVGIGVDAYECSICGYTEFFEATNVDSNFKETTPDGR